MMGYRRWRAYPIRGENVKRMALAVTVAALLPVLSFAASEAPAASAGPLQTEDQKVLYALGAALAAQAKVFSLTGAELEFVQMGLKDGVSGKLLVDMEVYGPKLNELAKTRMQAAAEQEKVKSAEYLAKAKKEKGAKVSKSGLIYFELKKGKGPSPTAQDTVKAHYKGTLLDGTVFDASLKHGSEPVEFPLGGVIPCWTEGLQKMKAGGKAKLVCPSDIAYGERGNRAIPGNSTLIFEVELMEIVKAKKEAPAAAAKPAAKPEAKPEAKPKTP